MHRLTPIPNPNAARAIRRITPHDLRHTCATLLLSQNVHPKYVQELLGHAKIAMTLDRYSHWIPSMGDHTARAMEAALG
ncbi:MAG: tyrosine-type recombinase/integrase [Rubrobacter sp.]|nr:tyrosine-type recombinase/integrase [Rubrobacter sp.]